MEKVWFCKVGAASESELPEGSDEPMRKAVETAYRMRVGHSPDFLFSGWGAELSEAELAVVGDREPDPVAVAAGVLAGLTGSQRELLDEALRATRVHGHEDDRVLLLSALDEADAIVSGRL